MQPDETGPGIVAARSFSRKQVNQDACASVMNPFVPLSAVIVADGIGSHYGADVAARAVTASMAEDLNLTGSRRIDMRRLFAQAQECLQSAIDERGDLPPDLDWNRAFGTTLLCAAETADSLTLAYTGNGGIFHIRGNFNTFPSSQLLPWNAMNYLNPHSFSREGRSVMYKLLSPKSSAAEIAPSVIALSKDDSFFGDIIVCCTDGIYSYDQTAIGHDEEKRIWISGEESMVRLFQCLRTFFKNEPDQDALGQALESYLTGLDAAGLVTDDCTVGVLITRKALAYQSQLCERRVVGALT